MFVSVPQIFKTVKTRRMRDVSLLTFLINFTQTGLWCLYGVLNGILPLMIFTGLNSLFSLIVVILKLVLREETK
ncbi:SemiSWEET family transporter [Candidatus Saccharibacteria bacterium]|nr:SemiSWEET family transporter [Candidatus Saccharibacteria bacterium]